MPPSTPGKSLWHRALRAVAGPWLALLAACGDVTPAFGPDAATARTNATQLFGGLAASFAPARYDATYERARARFSANFLAPSSLHGDPSLWSATEGTTRVLHSRALFTGTTYDQVALPGAPPVPVALGESRHRIALTALGGSRFAWDTRVEWALGPGRAQAFEELPGLLALSADASAAAVWGAELPRSARALGRLVGVDTVRSDEARDGTRLVTYVVRMRPARVQAAFPELAGFVERYVGRSSFDFQLRDARGAQWLEAIARENVLRLRLRVAPSGAFVPLLGPPGPMPSALQLTGSIYARGGWAGVELNRIVADVTLDRDGPRRGFTLRWRTEPKWGFPFSVDRLVAGTLRAPFEGEGVTVAFGFEDGPQGQLLLVRRLAGHFEESRLVRWMGALAGSVFGAWTGKVEPDANRFLTEGFGALRDDLRSEPAGSGPGPGDDAP
ncbi:MAG: hypothetical protein ACK53A_10310 [Gemmatimonadota bacterium]|jgi:hypothetical protein|nr:hypothetical protein [Gemmatimonadota bacterium]